MRSIQFRRVAAFSFAVALALGACGGASGGATNDPVGSVQAALAAVSSGGFSKLADFACAAKKNDLGNVLGNGGTGAFAAAGISQSDVFSAMSMSFSNVTATQTAKTDTTASVHVTGNSTITFDKDKMRAIMKTMLSAQGQQVTDAMLDATLTGMTAQFATPQSLDETIDLVNEGGKWLICG